MAGEFPKFFSHFKNIRPSQLKAYYEAPQKFHRELVIKTRAYQATYNKIVFGKPKIYGGQTFFKVSPVELRKVRYEHMKQMQTVEKELTDPKLGTILVALLIAYKVLEQAAEAYGEQESNKSKLASAIDKELEDIASDQEKLEELAMTKEELKAAKERWIVNFFRDIDGEMEEVQKSVKALEDHIEECNGRIKEYIKTLSELEIIERLQIEVEM